MTAPWEASLHAFRQRRAQAAEKAQQPYAAPHTGFGPPSDDAFAEVRAWHCKGCEVDWTGASRACWACEGQGQPGRLVFVNHGHGN